MRKSYLIRVTRGARADLIEIEDFIFSDSPQNSRKVSVALQSAIDSLAELPYRCNIYEKNTEAAEIVYSMPVGSFMIFFRVLELQSLVEVLTVRRGARDKPPRFFG